MRSEEKVISVIVYTVLVNYPLDVAASFIFILGFNSVQFVPETGLAGSTSIILGGGQWVLPFFHGPYTQSLLLPQPFCKTCSVPDFIG